MNISKDLVAELEKKLGVKPTENRIRRWLLTLDTGEAPTPASGTVAAESSTPLTPFGVSQARAVIKRASQALPTLTKPREFGSLEEAALLLLGIMEPNNQDAVKEIALDMGHPVWVIMLSAVSRIADNRELSALDVAPEWLNEPGKIVPTPKTVTCQSEGCGLEIPGARRGQIACCNSHGSGRPEHSPGCPAAVAAGLDVSPKVETPPVEETKPEPAPIPSGTCQFCLHPILNGRPTQMFCCNGCGVGKEHSDTCATGKALAQEAPQA